MTVDEGMLQEFVGWATERQKVWYRKEIQKLPRSEWTKDPIIAVTSFCNVRREDDRGTKDNIELIRVWHGSFVYPVIATMARYFNRRESLEIIHAHVKKRSGDVNLFVLEAELIQAREDGVTLFNSAYMAFAQGVKGDRITMLFERLFTPMMYDLRDIHLAIAEGDNQELFDAMERKHMKGFLTQQVLIDMAHTPLMDHMDYKEEFTVMGPGSERGIAKIFGDAKNFMDKISFLRKEMTIALGFDISAHDTQNICCEGDKYTRVKADPSRKLKKYKPK